MTNQPKPLSETHLTLWKELSVRGMQDYTDDIDTSNSLCGMIQRNTVDVAEHDDVKEQLELCKIANRNIADWVETLKDELVEFKKSNANYLKQLSEREAEVERLKKELARIQEQNKNLVDLVSHNGEIAFHNGVVEGERRTIERVLKAIDKHCFPHDYDDKEILVNTDDLREELGLGDNVKPFNPDTDHHNCSVGTCAACGHFNKEEK